MASAAGHYLIEWEQAQFDYMVADLFGYKALQLGLTQLNNLRQNRIADQGMVVEAISAHQDGLNATHFARFDMLPFANESIDLVVLPHTLEYVDAPRLVLREVARILRPEGHLVLSCFNPNSLWGLRHSWATMFDQPWFPQGMQAIPYARVKAWLRLLGFEIDGGCFGCYRLPALQEKWLRYSAFMDKAGDRWWPIFGAVYMLSAVKREAGIRLIGPTWRQAIPKPRITPAAQPVPCDGRNPIRAYTNFSKQSTLTKTEPPEASTLQSGRFCTRPIWV